MQLPRHAAILSPTASQRFIPLLASPSMTEHLQSLADELTSAPAPKKKVTMPNGDFTSDASNVGRAAVIMCVRCCEAKRSV